MAASPQQRGSGVWMVLIEQMAGSTGAWMPDWSQLTYRTRDEARQAALDATARHIPRQPLSPRNRMVLRHDPDNYTVVVEGVTTTFHFRVSVVERLA